jgi:ABC-type transporter Mla MlaB component
MIMSLLRLNDLFGVPGPERTWSSDRGRGRTTRIVLTGTVDRAAANELVVHCRRLTEQGWRRLLIDISAVSACDDAAVAGLTELREGWYGLHAEVVGAVGPVPACPAGRAVPRGRRGPAGDPSAGRRRA